MSRAGPNAAGPVWRRLPSGIWVLGFVSLLMDVSSEMIHALLPVYLVVGLGTTALTVGIIEGIAEAAASITKIFSGALSDRIGRRKELAALGSTGSPLSASPSSRWRRPSAGSSPPASWTASERAFGAPHEMRSSPTSARQTCAARASVCASRSTRSAPSSDHYWRSV